MATPILCNPSARSTQRAAMSGRRSGRPRRPAIVAPVVLVAVLAGCGDGSTEPASTASDTTATSEPAIDGEPSATTAPVVTGEPTAAAPTSTVTTSDAVTGSAPDDPVAATPPPMHPSVDDYPAGRVLVEPGDGADPIPVAVRIADTPERRSHGLMEVEEVPDGAGMWFTYDEDSTGRYYMLGTRTDLDIAWVDAEGTIVATESMTVCAEEPCERYDPGAAYRSALEVAAGWLTANDVEVGDRITLDETRE